MPTKISAGTNAITSAIPGNTLCRKLRCRPRTRWSVCRQIVTSAQIGALRGPSYDR